MDAIGRVHTLTFDALGTILDLSGSHAPRLGAYLKSKGSDMKAEDLYEGVEAVLLAAAAADRAVPG